MLVPYGLRPHLHCFRFHLSVYLTEKESVVFQNRRHVRVFRSQGIFPYRQRLLEQRLGVGATILFEVENRPFIKAIG